MSLLNGDDDDITAYDRIGGCGGGMGGETWNGRERNSLRTKNDGRNVSRRIRGAGNTSCTSGGRAVFTNGRPNDYGTPFVYYGTAVCDAFIASRFRNRLSNPVLLHPSLPPPSCCNPTPVAKPDPRRTDGALLSLPRTLP